MMMAEHYGETPALVGRVARELATCRQRGLDWLDLNTRRQPPIQAPTLQWLAQRYAICRSLTMQDRISQIKILIRDALEELSRQDSEPDARLIRDLFFGDSTQPRAMHAGELLERAQRNYGEPDEVRFRERRQAALRAFADFLMQFVDGAERDSLGAVASSEHTVITLPGRPDASDESDGLMVTTGKVGERRERYIQLLTEAD